VVLNPLARQWRLGIPAPVPFALLHSNHILYSTTSGDTVSLWQAKLSPRTWQCGISMVAPRLLFNTLARNGSCWRAIGVGFFRLDDQVVNERVRTCMV